MVAFTIDYNIIIDRRIHFYSRKLCPSSFYLFTFLNLKFMYSKEKALETLVTINMAFILLFLFFNIVLILKLLLIFSAICLLFPILLKRIHNYWSTFFFFIGKLNSTILLSLIFIIFLTPIALLQRLFKSKNSSKMYNTNFLNRNYTFKDGDLKRMG